MQSSRSRWCALALAFATLSCGSEPVPHCRIDGECVSGVCGADGVCAPSSTDASVVDASALSDAGAADGGLPDAGSRDASVADGATNGCLPNNDGRIDSSELPFGAGREARYRISKDVDPFMSAPVCSGTSCGWDYVDVGGQTSEAIVETLPVDGLWFMSEPAFSTATYAAVSGEFEIPFVCTQLQLGVYRADAAGLWLLGIVSELETDGTKLVFDPPVAVLSYPLEVGHTWTTDTVARGPLCNSLVDYAIQQRFTSEVDARGYFVTPYGRFEDTLRINTHFQRFIGVGVTPTESRTHTFVAECFTTVGIVQSEDGDGASEISPARDVRRLTPF